LKLWIPRKIRLKKLNFSQKWKFSAKNPNFRKKSKFRQNFLKNNLIILLGQKRVEIVQNFVDICGKVEIRVKNQDNCLIITI